MQKDTHEKSKQRPSPGRRSPGTRLERSEFRTRVSAPFRPLAIEMRRGCAKERALVAALGTHPGGGRAAPAMALWPRFLLATHFAFARWFRIAPAGWQQRTENKSGAGRPGDWRGRSPSGQRPLDGRMHFYADCTHTHRLATHKTCMRRIPIERCVRGNPEKRSATTGGRPALAPGLVLQNSDVALSLAPPSTLFIAAATRLEPSCCRCCSSFSALP